MSYILHLVVFLSIYVIAALSLNFVVGYLGKLTMAHAAFFAVGGYTSALATLKLGWGFLPSAALGIAIAAVLSLAVSMPAWRFRGDYFVLVSLAAQVVIFSLIYNWTSPGKEIGSLENLTNGPFGISGIPKPIILGMKLDSLGEIALLAVMLAGCCAFIAWLLASSPWGRLLKCIRDDELATRSLGKNVRLVKVQAFSVACGMVALAGAIYTSYVGYIDPSLAALDHSLLMLSMVIVGGLGNFTGPLVGAGILVALPELLRLANLPDPISASIRLMVFGLLLVLMMHFRPQGIAGEYRIE
jgi:branched-chain amino acid transport system permease protein